MAPETKASQRTDRRRKWQFSLLTLVIVVLTVQVAFPLTHELLTYRDRRITRNERAVIAALREIIIAQQHYKCFEGTSFGTLSQLSTPSWPYIHPDLGSGTLAGYVFDLRPYQSGAAYTCIATPVEPGVTGNRIFFADTAAVIRVCDPRIECRFCGGPDYLCNCHGME